SLVLRLDGPEAQVELVYNVEQESIDRSDGRVLEQKPPDSEVQLRALDLWNEGVGRLEHAVMKESVSPWPLENKPIQERRLQSISDLVRRLRAQRTEQLHRELIADVGGQFQDIKGAFGQAPQLAEDELDHIVGDLFGLDLRDIPSPCPPPCVKT